MDAFAELKQADRASVLHPFANLKDAAGKLDAPRIITGGNGIRIVDQDGRELIDGFADLYCVNIGYGRAEVAEAIAKQARELSYFHIYAANSTEPVIRLSQRLVKMAPARMSKVFYGLTGSDANETQTKVVWYYNNILGRQAKKKIIARERGYHGCSVISGSITGMSFYPNYMDLPVSGILHKGVPHITGERSRRRPKSNSRASRAGARSSSFVREPTRSVASLRSRCSAREASFHSQTVTGWVSRQYCASTTSSYRGRSHLRIRAPWRAFRVRSLRH